MTIKIYKSFKICGYSKAVIQEADRSRGQPITLSCILNTGTCKLKMSNWHGAIASCVKALEINPWSTKALCHRAQGLQGLKENNQALAHI
jgi:peptidyl-prolyl isomerase D